MRREYFLSVRFLRSFQLLESLSRPGDFLHIHRSHDVMLRFKKKPRENGVKLALKSRFFSAASFVVIYADARLIR